MGGRSPVTRCAASPISPSPAAVRRSCTRSTNALHHLAVAPNDWRLLAGEPDRIPVGDRRVPPLHDPDHPSRPDRDVEVEVGGRVVPAGAAGVDLLSPAPIGTRPTFEHADELRLDRKPNRHVAFGHGPHTCVGAPMARLVLQIALEQRARPMCVDRARRRSATTPRRDRLRPPSSRATTGSSCSAGGEAERFAECHRSLAVTIGIPLS